MRVVVQQWSSLVAIDLHPITDDLFGVVGAAAAPETLDQLVLGDTELHNRIELPDHGAPASDATPACSTERGKPSRMNPFDTSSWSSRSSTSSLVRLAAPGHRRRDTFAFKPSGVPLLMLSRNRSPVEICGIPSFSANWTACVPLPAPGGPSKTISLQEPFVVALHQLAFDLLNRIQTDANHDENGRTAERQIP